MLWPHSMAPPPPSALPRTFSGTGAARTYSSYGSTANPSGYGSVTREITLFNMG